MSPASGRAVAAVASREGGRETERSGDSRQGAAGRDSVSRSARERSAHTEAPDSFAACRTPSQFAARARACGSSGSGQQAVA
ncbi:hypothetical protein [Streptosporangium sp. LJ11]|uniref:hypothetical protein n=1 Tax=Streptosporangium sp. LJ11 TaxID=3436927 RepID=UPI003F7A5EF9